LSKIETRVNEWIMDNRPVTVSEMALKDVTGTDIVAVFDEKYGESVRVIGVDGVSRELCGGTHARHTGQIGMFRIVSEASVAAGVRRIEAVCGTAALEWTQHEHETLDGLCRRLSASAAELPMRVESLVEDNRRLEKELRRQAAAMALGQLDALVASAADVNGIPLVAGCVGEVPPDALKELCDAVRTKVPSGVIALAATHEGKALFAASASDDAIRRGAHAGKLIGAVAKRAGGGGGGQPGRAQAGG
jgi:alanyl-tRNA synthetase